MKSHILLLLSAVGSGLLGVSASTAGPTSGVAIGTAASADHLIENVRWYGRGLGWGPWGYSRGWGPGWGYTGVGPGWGYAGWHPAGCHHHPHQCGRWS